MSSTAFEFLRTSLPRTPYVASRCDPEATLCLGMDLLQQALQNFARPSHAQLDPALRAKFVLNLQQDDELQTKLVQVLPTEFQEDLRTINRHGQQRRYLNVLASEGNGVRAMDYYLFTPVSIIASAVCPNADGVEFFIHDLEPQRDGAIGWNNQGRITSDLLVRVEATSIRAFYRLWRSMEEFLEGPAVMSYDLDGGQRSDGEEILTKLACCMSRDHVKYGVFSCYTQYVLLEIDANNQLLVSQRIDYRSEEPSVRESVFAMVNQAANDHGGRKTFLQRMTVTQPQRSEVLILVPSNLTLASHPHLHPARSTLSLSLDPLWGPCIDFLQSPPLHRGPPLQR
ncbi:hypothetical protein T439DRAFT_119514 [Meredithblackwellia eburnea MCA 4105]